MPALRPEIIREEAEWLAVNKPAGWLSVPDRFDPQLPHLFGWLKKRYPEVLIVHRLDKDTSGVMLFARTGQAHHLLCQQFASRSVHKVYLGIVEGRVDFQEKTLDMPISPDLHVAGKMRIDKSGRQAITHLHLMEQFTRHAYLQIIPATGRTHQIRLHLQYVGYPLVADPLYGNGQALMASALYRHFRHKADEKPLLTRTALHAAVIEFTDPKGEKQHVEAPLPKDMKAALYQLRKSSCTVHG
jgi:23S rRNA pseudouridine1911/1915/1917 synthase